MVTALGRFLRKLRIDNGEILRDMAQKLNVSSAFLSAVENGKKKIPDAWFTKLTEIYSLTLVQQEDLKSAILESGDVVELNIQDLSDDRRRLAIKFARSFDSLDDDEWEKIRKLLNSNKGD